MCYEGRRAEALCGRVCPSRTSERGGEGDCVKEGGADEGERERERALVGGVRHSPQYIEVDPQRRRFGRRQSDCALQALEEEGVLPSYIVSYLYHHIIYLE